MADLDPVFFKITNLLMKQAQNAESVLRNLLPARWEDFELTDSAKKTINDLFTRLRSELNYQRAIEDTNTGSIKDLVAAKLQSDVLSEAERDFKRRRQRRIRTVTHEAVRRGGHGHEEGPIAKGLQFYPRQILQRDGK